MSVKISVITVAYNACDVLEQTILSVIGQNYDNLEYIVIDGGSTDGSVDIIKKYDDKITYWVSEPDKGIYDAMNKGVAVSTGEWVNFMNAGDVFYNKSVLSEIYFEKYNNFDVLYGAVLFKSKFMDDIVSPAPLNTMITRIPFNHQAVFSKCIITKFNTEYKLCADYDLFYGLYVNNYKFKELKNTVAIFDGEGVSCSNLLDVYRESYLIQKKYNRKNARLIYWYKVFKTRVLNVIERIAPNKCVQFLYKVKG